MITSLLERLAIIEAHTEYSPAPAAPRCCISLPAVEERQRPAPYLWRVIRVLAGCAPCQPFSTYSQRYETVGTPRWGLMYHFARLIKNTRPEFVTMENVPTVIKHDVYKDFVRTLVNLGYHVSSKVVDCTMYGLPQTRRRTVLLASLDRTIELIAREAFILLTQIWQNEPFDLAAPCKPVQQIK